MVLEMPVQVEHKGTFFFLTGSNLSTLNVQGSQSECRKEKSSHIILSHRDYNAGSTTFNIYCTDLGANRIFIPFWLFKPSRRI